MRTKPKYNFPEFFRAAIALRRRGWNAINPAEVDIASDEDIDLMLTVEEQLEKEDDPLRSRIFARRDVDILFNELDSEDAIVTLDDWEESTGACAEVAIAKWLGIEHLTLNEALGRKNES